ncbi:MAG: hypothetical protein PHG44_10160, partial [Lentisphaeria bacterium]|nr:hypothetical protein [Lentisphaeria bacterium]
MHNKSLPNTYDNDFFYGSSLKIVKYSKTKTVYVPVDMVEELRGWVKEHKRLQKIVKEINALAEQLIRLHVPVARAESRRKKSL